MYYKNFKNNNNLFGNSNDLKQKNNNLFGNLNDLKQKNNNLFGNSNAKQNKNINLFGNPNPNQPLNNELQQQNIKNVDQKEIYSIYQKSKQYLPHGQQAEDFKKNVIMGIYSVKDKKIN